jgi:hypothetical protein
VNHTEADAALDLQGSGLVNGRLPLLGARGKDADPLLAPMDGAAGVKPGLEAADERCVGHLQTDEELVAETVAMEPRHHGEIAAPGVGVAEGGDGALEVGAGLGGVGVAAFGLGTCLLLNEAAPGVRPARRVWR